MKFSKMTLKVNFERQNLSESFQRKFSLKNIILEAYLLLLIFFENFNFQSTLFTKIMLIFVSWILSFSKRYENDFRVIFDQWPKLNLGFDVKSEIRILKVIYYLCKVSLYRFLWWWAPAAPMYNVFSHLLLAAIEKKHGGLLKKVMALYLISFIDFLSSSLNQGKTRQMQIFRARFIQGHNQVT